MTILVFLVAAAEQPPQCRQIHYLEDGRVVESRVADTGDASSTSSSAASTASGHGSAHSSVSAGTKDGASTSTSSSNADGKYRSVSVTRDERGCTITIDERPPQGDDK